MEKQTHKLFPTLVHYFKDVLSPAQLSTISRHCLELEAGEHESFVGDTKSSFSTDSRLIEDLEVRYSALKGLTQGLAGLIREYGRELGFDNVSMTNSWCNVQYPGSVLKHHVHPKSKVSAAVYIHADEKSSKLFLENPNTFLNFIRPDHYTESMFEFAKFDPVPGDLILFPSWIKHGSGFEANQSEHRIVISVNAS